MAMSTAVLADADDARGARLVDGCGDWSGGCARRHGGDGGNGAALVATMVDTLSMAAMAMAMAVVADDTVAAAATTMAAMDVAAVLVAQMTNVAHATTRAVRLAMAEAEASPATVAMGVDGLGVAAPTAAMAAGSAIGCGGEMRLLVVWRRWPCRWRRRQITTKSLKAIGSGVATIG